MKFLIKLLLFILAAILAGLLVAQPAIAEAPQSNSSNTNPPYGPIQPKNSPANDAFILGDRRQGKKEIYPSGIQSGRHSTRAKRTISAEALQKYLAKEESPLAPFADDLLQSPYYSTIIGICTIEQYGCTHAPANNYWGIMSSSGHLQQFATLQEGILAISNLLSRYESKGEGTIEELNCYYVQPCSSNWLNTVIKTKQEIESL